MPAHVHIPTCIKHPPEEKTTKKKTNKSGLKVTSSAPHPNQRGRKKEEEKKKTKRKQKKKKKMNRKEREKRDNNPSYSYLSKEVDFQTKSTTKLWVHSAGTPALLFSSMATSSL